LNAIVFEFNRANPWGITVQASYQGSYATLHKKVLAALGGDGAPDLAVAYSNQAATYQLSEALADLNPLINSPRWGLSAAEQADFYPNFLAADVSPFFGGRRLGLPPNRSLEALYVNLDWLAELGYSEPPAHPQQFKEMACKAAANPFSRSGSTRSAGLTFEISASTLASLTFAFGGDIYDAQANRYTYDSPAAQAAAAFLQDLVRSGCARLPAQRFGEQADFAAGRTLFTFGTTAGLPYYQQAVERGAAFAWTVSAIPHTTAAPVANLYGGSVSILRSTPPRELAAWLFLKHFTSPEVQARWAQASSYFPVRRSAAAGLQGYLEANPPYRAAFALVEFGRFEPPVPGYDPVRADVAGALAGLLSPPYPEVGAALRALNAAANAILADHVDRIP
jgi:multiple sugar transport system substrate-binding protein/sn-glycerol 3-phosphate transport system substrate-binding protein